MKGCRIALAAVVLLLLVPEVSGAGAFLAGAKGWYAVWDSSVLEWFEKDIAVGFLENGLVLQTRKDPGTGFLLGPTLGYQTDDQKWSFSLAMMLLGRFSQDWEGQASSLTDPSSTMALDSELSIDRADYDFAANYFLRENLRLFMGLKYQTVEMDFELAYDTSMGRRNFTYRLDQQVFMPTVGLSFVHPLSERWAIGSQAGILYAIPELSIRELQTGDSFDIWPRPTLGFNGEVSATVRMSPAVLLQMGYRYQLFQLVARDPDRWEETVSNDVTQGLTLSVTWMH